MTTTNSTVCASNARFSPSRFTGKERDTESGNDYFGARYYSSAMGRFMSPDPYNINLIKQGMEAGGLPAEAAESFFYGFLENPQNLNQYNYVRNNPLRLVDPTGSAPAEGHHLISLRSKFQPGSLSLDFAKSIKTGKLSGDNYPNQPGHNAMHAEYDEAVEEKLAQAEQVEGENAGWDLSQWKAFATSILNSDDERIANFLDELETHNPGAKAALAASIAGYRITALTVARIVAAGVGASLAARMGTLSHFIVCVTCNITHESVTFKILKNPPMD